MAEHTVGSDGRIYYKYNVGAVYIFYPAIDAPFVYEILDCDFQAGEEKYLIQDGTGKEGIFAASQLDFIFSFLEYEQSNTGELRELPLMPEEVEAFYKAKKQGLEIANKGENQKLKGTEYGSLLSGKYALQRELKLAEAEGKSGEVKTLKAKLAEQEKKIDKVLSENGVDRKILTKVAACEVCKDTGIVEGKICKCAFARAEAIKVFNANLRLEKK